MLVLQGTTPEETRTSIVEFLEGEAERYAKDAKRQRLKGERSRDMARCNVLTGAAIMIKECALADLHPRPALHPQYQPVTEEEG